MDKVRLFPLSVNLLTGAMDFCKQIILPVERSWSDYDAEQVYVIDEVGSKRKICFIATTVYCLIPPMKSS